MNFVVLRIYLLTTLLNFVKFLGTLFNLPTLKFSKFFILFKSVATSANSLMSSLSNSAFKEMKSKPMQSNEIILYVHGLDFNAESITDISFDQFFV